MPQGDLPEPSAAPAPSSAQMANQCAAYMKALADPTRMRILGELRRGARTVTQLVDVLSIDQPSVSHHLAIMKQVSLVDVEARGRYRIYRLHPALVQEEAEGESTVLDFGCCKLLLTS